MKARRRLAARADLQTDVTRKTRAAVAHHLHLADRRFLVTFCTANAVLAAEIERLSPAEKLLLVEELWNQIARKPNAVEPPAWHDAVLAEDAQRHAANPSPGDSWENVKRRIACQL